MLKQLFTLARGRATDAGEAYLDANAISLLRQQIREAAEGVARSRKAVAVTMAYAEREKTNLVKLDAQIADLEARATDALDKGREDLARDAAEAIADLDADRDAARRTVEVYDRDIAALRQSLKQSETQLTELKRGQRLAEATAKTQSVPGTMPAAARADLSDAAQTLRRLRDRQTLADGTMAAATELSTAKSAEAVSNRLVAAGMPPPNAPAPMTCWTV